VFIIESEASLYLFSEPSTRTGIENGSMHKILDYSCELYGRMVMLRLLRQWVVCSGPITFA